MVDEHYQLGETSKLAGHVVIDLLIKKQLNKHTFL